MTSREIVSRTIDYDSPELVARSFRDSDICGAGCSAAIAPPEESWSILVCSRWQSLPFNRCRVSPRYRVVLDWHPRRIQQDEEIKCANKNIDHDCS
ncbi:MAG: hypothetical protein KAH23_05415 [Kiritimatiellae bacterium]|nr:hypothetical protein [Kiritimatiellia bacterium]